MRNSRIFVWALILMCISLCASAAAFSIEDYLESAPIQERSRYHFSNAIESWGLGLLAEAQAHIDLAFQTPMYPLDIPIIWYFLAKLYIEAGDARQAVESLNNVLLIQPDRTEILILLRTLRAFFQPERPENPVIGLEYFHDILGYQEGIEIFYNPVSADVFKERFYVLDRANRSILVSHGQIKKLYPIDMPAPSALVIDPFSQRLYVSDIELGIIRVFDTETIQPIEDLPGFSRPFIQDVDRIGNLYVLDPPRNLLKVISSEGRHVRNLFLSEGFGLRIVNDVVVNPEYIVLQDLSLKAFRILRYPSFEEERTIPFPQGVLPIVSSIDCYHSLLSIGSDGQLYSISLRDQAASYTIIDTTKIELLGMSDMDVVPPLIVFTDFQRSKVLSFNMLRENPNAITLIDGLEVLENQLMIHFRTLQSSGEELQIIQPFLRVIDGGGFVPFTPGFVNTTVRVWEFDSGRAFFEEHLPALNRSETNIVFWRYDGYAFVEENVLPSMLAKNVRLFIESNMILPERIRDMAYTTGGAVITSDLFPHALRYFQSVDEKPIRQVRYELMLPFQGIKTVTISVRIGGLDYSDSIYYVNYMIPSLKESLIHDVDSDTP